jgi:hypothetical protein
MTAGANARDAFASCFTSLLESSGLQANQVAARVNARRPRGALWSLTGGLLSAWKTGRNLPSEANQDAFILAVRVLSEHARRRAGRGHEIGPLPDEVRWGRLLREARALHPADDANRQEVVLYLEALVRWLNADPWPGSFGGHTLSPATIERKLKIADSNGYLQELHADELARSCQRLVVLGAPGSGKTWLAKRTARLSAERALAALAGGAALEETELPLYTTCFYLFAADGDIRQALASSALDHLPDLGGARVSAALRLVFAERNAPTVLVIDSLDEARGSDDRLRQADTLPPSWRIVLTSRPAAWNHQISLGRDDPSRRAGELRPLVYPDDVDAFITRWYSDRPEWGESLRLQLASRPDLQQAATVPLLLAFYCVLGGSAPLPANGNELYTKVINRMLTGRWRDSNHRESNPEKYRDILREWAWGGASADPVSGVGNWADEVISPQSGLTQADRDALDHVAAPVGPPDPDTGLIARRFVHRTIREHLVADYVARMPAVDAGEELLDHLWYDPDWEYAAPAALAMHPERDQVLRHLICRAARSAIPPEDLTGIDGYRELRQFLARVARESRQDQWNLASVAIIVRARLEASIYSPLRLEIVHGWPDSNRQIRHELLGRLDSAQLIEADELVTALCKLEPEPDDLTRARRRLLKLVSSDEARSVHVPFAEMMRKLGVDPEDLSQAALTAPDTSDVACRRILEELEAADEPETAYRKVRELIELYPSPHDLKRARGSVLNMIDNPQNSWAIIQLVDALCYLEPSVQDLTRARNRVLDMLETGAPGNAIIRVAALCKLGLEAVDQARVRNHLLDLLGRVSYPEDSLMLSLAVLCTLDVEKEALVRVLKRVLNLLETADYPLDTLALAPALSRLMPMREVAPEGQGPEPNDLSRVRVRLLDLLEAEGVSWRAASSVAALNVLGPSPDDLARAYQRLLQLINAIDQPRRLYPILEALSSLGLDQDDLADARRPVLDLIYTVENPRSATTLALELNDLQPDSTDLAKARGRMLNLLASAQSADAAMILVQGLKDCGAVPNELTQMRRRLIDILGNTSYSAPEVAEMLNTLQPGPADITEARNLIMNRLTAAVPQHAESLMQALTWLTPDANDLASCSSWPVYPDENLLAAVRRNSQLPSWLNLLPKLPAMNNIITRTGQL